MPTGTAIRPLDERFYAKVEIGPPHECWMWTASRFARHGVTT